MNHPARSDDARSHRSEVSAVPCGWTPPSAGKRQRLLYFTKTVGFEHSAVRRAEGALSHSEQVLIEMGRQAGFDVECAKDGRVFDGDLDRFDAIAFYTLGDLTRREHSPSEPMSEAGKQRLLEAIAAGKPFVGFHSATDTFYGEGLDPYIEMVGAEFCGHGVEQEGVLRVTSAGFPGMEGMNDMLRFYEEWYCFKKVSKQMHVILALETPGMQGNLYDRPPMPATWARMYGKGRVFYTSLGHREEVWNDPRFQQIAFAGLAWALGNVDADVCENFDAATPGGDFYRKMPQEPGTISR
jgi:hypothetical protein